MSSQSSEENGAVSIHVAYQEREEGKSEGGDDSI